MREGGNEDGYFRADRAFLVLSAFIWLASPACADSGSDYKAGSDFAKQVQGNGLNSLKISVVSKTCRGIPPTRIRQNTTAASLPAETAL